MPAPEKRTESISVRVGPSFKKRIEREAKLEQAKKP
jgi:hypothetical protein